MLKLKKAEGMPGIRFICLLSERDKRGWRTAIVIPEKEYSTLLQWDVKVVNYSDTYDNRILDAVSRTQPLAAFNRLTDAKRYVQYLNQ